MPILRVLLLGPPQIQRQEQPVQVEARKAMALLAYLALSPTVRGRDELAALLWPEHPKSRNRLRHALWAAKKAIGQEHLIVQREIIGLRQDEEIFTDVVEFRRLLAAYQTHGHTAQKVCDRCLEPLVAAVDLYHGDFLAGFSLADSPAFDDWQTFQTESLRQELGEALGRLVRLHSNRGEFEPAIEYGRRRLALDPLLEPAQRELMQVTACSGRASVALRQYGEFVALLDEEIGVPPEQETIDLAEAIRSGDLASPKPGQGTERDGPSPAERGIGDQRGVVRNLPTTSGSFIGRRQELDEIARLLRDEPDCRLLTLVGLGGVGKTALAIQAAAEVAASFEQGAVFVPLAQVDDVAYLPLAIAIASALDIPIGGSGEPKAQLINILRHREVLLVLDNFEQLLAGEATGLLSELLAGTGRAKLLVTSRERLKLSEEWGFVLAGLHYPDRGADESESIEDYSAVQLFLQNVRRARPELALTGENRRQVLRVCRLVDGLPLALKLAAGWSRLMTIRQIADEIESNLGFLESTLRGIPDRHQSMRAVFNHSWALLTDAEREAFMKLSVFRGGFTRQAAERVAEASLSMLLRLADKSLLHRTGDGRFQLHELLGWFASEQLEGRPGGSEAARDVHADFYATSMARRNEDIHGVRQEEILAELTTERDNIRAAWSWACAQGHWAMLGKSAECLARYHDLTGRFQEGALLCRQGVESLKKTSEKHKAEDSQNGESDLALAQLLLGQAHFTNHLGRPVEAQPIAQQSVRLFRQSMPKSKRQLAFSLIWLAQVHMIQGDYTMVLDLTHESLRIHQEIGNKDGQGYASMQIGFTESYRGNYRTGRAYLRDAVRLLQEVENGRQRVLAEWNLGSVARAVGEFEEARRRLNESMRFSQSIGDNASLNYILREIGQLALDLGDEDEAERFFQQGLKVTSETSFRRLEAFFHGGLGVVARRRGSFEEARQWFETSLALFHESGDPRGVGLNLQNMGDLAFEDQRFADAERVYRRSLSQFEAIENRLGVASTHCSLGVALAVDPQQHGPAREQFQQTLSIASAIGATPVSLDALIGLAALASAEESSRESAVEWLALVLVHPAGKHETKENARALLANLATRMDPEGVAEAVRRGEARGLDEILAEASAS